MRHFKGVRGYAYGPHFWSGGLLYPHFVRAVTKITAQIRAFSTQPKFNCYCLNRTAYVADIALWRNYYVSVGNKSASTYVKCMKLFFGFPTYGSVSAKVIQLNLPSFNTVLLNATAVFHNRLKLSASAAINAIR